MAFAPTLQRDFVFDHDHKIGFSDIFNKISQQPVKINEVF